MTDSDKIHKIQKNLKPQSPAAPSSTPVEFGVMLEEEQVEDGHAGGESVSGGDVEIFLQYSRNRI